MWKTFVRAGVPPPPGPKTTYVLPYTAPMGESTVKARGARLSIALVDAWCPQSRSSLWLLHAASTGLTRQA